MKVLDLYITKICNLDCEYCYVDVVKTEDTNFPVDTFLERKNLLEYDTIKFFGGEPLVKWKMIQQIIEAVREKKPEMQFSIVTNGILLSEEKIKYIVEHHINTVISVHAGAFELLRKKIDMLKKLGNYGGFYIIFDPKDFSVALRNFLYFFKAGFKNYCFAPEIYGDWNETNLRKLEGLLQKIVPIVMKHNMNISGISHNSLKVLNRGCEKTVIDETGTFRPCNRFKALEKAPSFNYKKVYDSFDETISFDNDLLRWFYICPVGWYLDNIEKGEIEQSIKNFKKLNHIFIRFYRQIHAGRLNFFSENIEEIRFNMTQQCNIRCKYCYVDFKNKSLNVDVAKNIIDFFFAQDGNRKEISFFGGEPLLEYKNLKELVEYANTLSEETGKEVRYNIATNFMIMSQEIIDFLEENNFNIHISFNGRREHNDIMRDGSSQKVLSNIEKFIEDPKKICILFAFSPEDADAIYENLEYLIQKGFRYFNLELIYGEQYKWRPGHLQYALDGIYRIKETYKDVKLKNLETKKRFLDINTDGVCSENSLEFFGQEIDVIGKQNFDRLLSKLR